MWLYEMVVSMLVRLLNRLLVLRLLKPKEQLICGPTLFVKKAATLCLTTEPQAHLWPRGPDVRPLCKKWTLHRSRGKCR